MSKTDGKYGIIYISLKSYPMDYVSGKLLVDPERMKKDGFGDIGLFMAFCLGRLIEKTWIRFEADCTEKNIILALTGGAILFFLIELLVSPMRSLFGLHWGTFVYNVLVMLFVVALWPAVMKLGMKEKDDERSVETH